MAEQTFNQEFKGFVREPNKGSLPSTGGIYCVHECTYNTSESTVTLHKIIYIGESEDINDRVNNHERLKDWQKHVRAGNELCYSYTTIGSNDRERVEAAFISHHRPIENTEYKDSFPFDKTIVKSSGRIGLLQDFFVANRK